MAGIYRPTLSLSAQEQLESASRDLGYIVTQKGRHVGNPSPPQMLEALAAAYRRDPAAVVAALRGAGVGKATAVSPPT